MIDRIIKKSKNEITVIYFDRPSITIYSDQGIAMYYLLEIILEAPCTTLKVA